MTTIFLYLLIQFNIGTADSSSYPSETPLQCIQSEDNKGSWEDED